MDEAVLRVLRGIEDPELGVNLVDLGLIYEARRAESDITVRLTATSRACPLGEYLREESLRRLARAFPEARRLDVELVWAPPWSPARISAEGRAQLMS